MADTRENSEPTPPVSQQARQGSQEALPPEPRPVSSDSSTGGWGSLRGIGLVLGREAPPPSVLDTLARQNKVGGTMCPSCAWGKPAHPHVFEFCENGAKATIWDLTTDRCTPDFFAKHKVGELLKWSDFDLEMQGRLTEPMRYAESLDRYIPCSWEDAFAAIGAQLKSLDPQQTTFYASGKAGLEASYLYGLFARLYGHNNLLDSSNMCHETTSVALKKTLGTPVGACEMDDFDHCDAIFYFGQNPGANSPRFLHLLQEAVQRGCKIVVFNPVRELGLLKFINPQNLLQMVTDQPTDLAHLYLQVRPGGDIAAAMGLCKLLLAADDQAIARSEAPIIDHEFIRQHTHGYEAFTQAARAADWGEIESNSGLTRDEISAAAQVYMEAKTCIAVYGMGLTQHVHGSQSVGMIVNLMLMRGNVGKKGAGVTPVRGHSNVQGQRTVGISEKPELVPLDRLKEQYGFEPPRQKGRNTVEVCEAVRDGSMRAFLSLGGNFVRAIPDRDEMEPAWRSLDLTVYIATKLNRSHLIHGRTSFLLPCLVRAEEDRQQGGPQSISIEDSFSHIYGSIGRRRPASAVLRSELAIVAGIAKATLNPNPKVKWDDWTDDYSLVRDEIEKTYPVDFKDFNDRMFQPGGFYRGNPARERIWRTPSGKAEFTTPTVLSALGVGDAPQRFHLITLRSNDQFNTTIYGFSDRLRGLEGSRQILLINPSDMRRMNLQSGDKVNLVGDAGDGAHRQVLGLTVAPFSLPDGCLGGYYPEMNPLIPLWYHDEASKTPAAKGVPVKIVKLD